MRGRDELNLQMEPTHVLSQEESDAYFNQLYGQTPLPQGFDRIWVDPFTTEAQNANPVGSMITYPINLSPQNSAVISPIMSTPRQVVPMRMTIMPSTLALLTENDKLSRRCKELEEQNTQLQAQLVQLNQALAKERKAKENAQIRSDILNRISNRSSLESTTSLKRSLPPTSKPVQPKTPTLQLERKSTPVKTGTPNQLQRERAKEHDVDFKPTKSSALQANHLLSNRSKRQCVRPEGYYAELNPDVEFFESNDNLNKPSKKKT